MISCLSVLSDSFHLLSRLLANMNKKKNFNLIKKLSKPLLEMLYEHYFLLQSI